MASLSMSVKTERRMLMKLTPDLTLWAKLVIQSNAVLIISSYYCSEILKYFQTRFQ